MFLHNRTYVAKLSEEGLDLLIADLGGQSTDEDLAVAGLGLLGVDLLVVDNMVAGGHDLVDRIGALVHDEGESSRAARVGVCLDVYALDLTVLAEVFLQFLCGWAKGFVEGKRIQLVNVFDPLQVCD